MEMAKSFAKSVLTLSSGAFGVTFLFLKEVVPRPICCTVWLLALSWLGFAVSIIAITYAFFTSQKSCNAEIENLESQYRNNKKLDNPWTPKTAVSNAVALWAMIAAMVAFTLFGVINIVHTGGIMMEHETKSFTPTPAALTGNGADSDTVRQSFEAAAAVLSPPAEETSQTAPPVTPTTATTQESD